MGFSVFRVGTMKTPAGSHRSRVKGHWSRGQTDGAPAGSVPFYDRQDESWDYEAILPRKTRNERKLTSAMKRLF